MIWKVLQGLVGLALCVMGYELTVNAPTTQKGKSQWRIAFVGVGVLGLAFLVGESWEEVRIERERFPTATIPKVRLETLPGLPPDAQTMSNAAHLRYHRLLVLNEGPARIDNFCGRLQLPEPIVATMNTNTHLGMAVSWKPELVRLHVEGTGGRNEGGFWIGPTSTVHFIYPTRCFEPPPGRGFLAALAGAGKLTGIWELIVDSIPPGGRIELEFLTSNVEETNYMALVSTPLWKTPPQSQQDPRELMFYLEGKFQFPGPDRPQHGSYFVPILVDSTNRMMASDAVQSDSGEWHPVVLQFQ